MFAQTRAVADRPRARGSANPYPPGPLRGAEAGRAYTATVVGQARPDAPAARATNTVYAGVPGQPHVTLIYRIYVTDKNRDATGDVGLPVPTLRLADGSTVSDAAVCDPQEVAEVPARSAGPDPWCPSSAAVGSCPRRRAEGLSSRGIPRILTRPLPSDCAPFQTGASDSRPVSHADTLPVT